MKRFPAYQDLTKEQDRAINLSLDGTYLVIGPPGTGKTVVALYRGAMLHKRGNRMHLLTRMKMLRQYTSGVLEKFDIAGDVGTFHSWFSSYYRDTTGKAAPQSAPYKYDWTLVLKGLLAAKSPPKELPYLIIDEGQDIPQGFYGLASIIARNLTVFADENQRLHGEESSTLKNIQREAVIGDEQVVHLTRNYRNTLPIAKLAAAFYCGLRSGIPALPTRDGETPEVRSYRTFDDEIDAIGRYERLNDDLQIGVLVPNTRILERVVGRLSGRSKRAVRYYSSQDRDAAPIDFGEPGIIVLNYESAKGLEFDAVFMPQMQKASRLGHHAEPNFKMAMYVMISRARDHLVISYTGSRPALFDAFPQNLCKWKDVR